MCRRYDHVRFIAWDCTSRSYERVCTVSLVEGQLVFEGPAAEETRRLVNENDYLEPYRAIGGYTLLAELGRAFCGSYFYATDVIDARLM